MGQPGGDDTSPIAASPIGTGTSSHPHTTTQTKPGDSHHRCGGTIAASQGGALAPSAASAGKSNTLSPTAAAVTDNLIDRAISDPDVLKLAIERYVCHGGGGIYC